MTQIKAMQDHECLGDKWYLPPSAGKASATKIHNMTVHMVLLSNAIASKQYDHI